MDAGAPLSLSLFLLLPLFLSLAKRKTTKRFARNTNSS